MKRILGLAVLVCLSVSGFAQVVNLGGSGTEYVVAANDGQGQARTFSVKAATPEKAVLAAAAWIGTKKGVVYQKYDARKNDWLVTWESGYSVSLTCSQNAPAEAAPAAVDAQVDVQPAEIDGNEVVRREELALAADEYVKSAAVAWSADKHREALDFYKKAETQLNQAGKSPRILAKLAAVKEIMVEVNVDWVESLAAEAQRLAEAGKFDEAVGKCRQAAEIDPSLQAEIERTIKQYQAHRKSAESP